MTRIVALTLSLWTTLVLSVFQHAHCFSSSTIDTTKAYRKSPVTVKAGSEGVADEDDDVSLEAFQARKKKQELQRAEELAKEEEDSFDGYALRDVILEKWGKCYDVDFNRVDSFGFRQLYLNIMPFHLGGRRFRHETELDYLCHLQAVAEILDKYDQVSDLLYFQCEFERHQSKHTFRLGLSLPK